MFGELTPAEMDLISKIADRTLKMMDDQGVSYGKSAKSDTFMDLHAVHTSMGLDLQAMAVADDADFGHDIGGIIRHLNRQTGELEDCFVPRLAKTVNSKS